MADVPVAWMTEVQHAAACTSYQSGGLYKRPPLGKLQHAAMGCGFARDERPEAIFDTPEWRDAVVGHGLSPFIAVHAHAIAWVRSGGLYTLTVTPGGRRVACGDAANFLRYFAELGYLEIEDWTNDPP
jgi:hypothetical protein